MGFSALIKNMAGKSRISNMLFFLEKSKPKKEVKSNVKKQNPKVKLVPSFGISKKLAKNVPDMLPNVEIP